MAETAENVKSSGTGFKIKKNLPEPNLSEQLIEVYVSDPIIKDGLNKYVIYKVSGNDAEGPFECMRRYSDFQNLRDSLSQKWPSCFIAPLPPKKTVGNLDASFIEERRRHLETFLNRIAKKQYLWYSEETKCLTRGVVDVEKGLKSLPKQTLEDLIKKYEDAFKDLGEKEINTDIIVKISTFQQYLKKINSNLVNFRTMADNMMDVQKKHNEMFKTFFDFMLPEYEKNCLNEYVNGAQDKYIFNSSDNQKLTEVVGTMKEFTDRQEFIKFLDIIRMEEKEIDAFNECYKKRDEYEKLKNKLNSNLKDQQIEMQKIMAGKGGGMFDLKKKSKEQMIEETQSKIDDCQKQNDQINFLCDVMTLILGYSEIDNFKQEKQEIYYGVLKQLAQFETEFAKAKIEMWGQILENQNMPDI